MNQQLLLSSSSFSSSPSSTAIQTQQGLNDQEVI